MHTAQLLKFWGPLVLLNEYPFERFNGMLQSIPTNKHVYELDLTMLQQMCRQARLAAVAADFTQTHPSNSNFGQVFNILYDKFPYPASSQAQIPNLCEYRDQLSEETYRLLFQRLNHGQPQRTSFVDCHQFPIPPGSADRVLFDWVKHRHHLEFRGYGYSDQSHGTLGNSTISFFNPASKEQRTGFITEIFTILLPASVEQTFLVVSPHLSLSSYDMDKDPYLWFPNLRCHIVYCRDSSERILITPEEIIFHVALYRRPKGTYGITEEIYVVNDTLNRGRVT
ncbi:hypothetical protein E1B28_006656 [Marasmius oreades]|uniref:Uncharacterized protein n=1 Tax=Marasmius oreades TaxID=181124 RepID=A0A9P7UWL5_9AGAR|nr:uncharacterized protein E1B28_006656 [Marasmius oreades]KAG7095973.1 hypothetical protein E1B28_006656 [Marasmius oreades]